MIVARMQPQKIDEDEMEKKDRIICRFDFSNRLILSFLTLFTGREKKCRAPVNSFQRLPQAYVSMTVLKSKCHSIALFQFILTCCVSVCIVFFFHRISFKPIDVAFFLFLHLFIYLIISLCVFICLFYYPPKLFVYFFVVAIFCIVPYHGLAFWQFKWR